MISARNLANLGRADGSVMAKDSRQQLGQGTIVAAAPMVMTMATLQIVGSAVGETKPIETDVIPKAGDWVQAPGCRHGWAFEVESVVLKFSEDGNVEAIVTLSDRSVSI